MTGDELRRRRKALGLTQAAFAAALGTALRTVEDWEAGRRTPRMGGMVERAVAALEAQADADCDRARHEADAPLREAADAAATPNADAPAW